MQEKDGASEAIPPKIVEETKEVEYPLGFFPRLNDHKVYVIGEDDYPF